MYKYVAILLLVGAVYAGDVSFTVCDSAQQATIHRFGVSDCAEGSTECTFVKGNTYHFELEATTMLSANALPYKVTATVLGIPITLVEGDACETITCPINAGDKILFSLEKEISTDTPSLNGVTVSARVWQNEAGNAGNAAACASIKASIVNA